MMIAPAMHTAFFGNEQLDVNRALINYCSANNNTNRYRLMAAIERADPVANEIDLCNAGVVATQKGDIDLLETVFLTSTPWIDMPETLWQALFLPHIGDGHDPELVGRLLVRYNVPFGTRFKYTTLQRELYAQCVKAELEHKNLKKIAHSWN